MTSEHQTDKVAFDNYMRELLETMTEGQRIQRFCPTCNRQYNYFGK